MEPLHSIQDMEIPEQSYIDIGFDQPHVMESAEQSADGLPQAGELQPGQENDEQLATHVPDVGVISLTEQSPTDLKKRVKHDVMPTWAATKSLLLTFSGQKVDKKNTEVVAPLFRTSPTDYGTLYTVLMLTQGISAVVVGPESKTLITLDLDLYNRALRIQQTVGNTNWVLRAGVLHIVFAALHALGKTIEGSGIDTCSIECGTYTSAALRGIYAGKAYKRGIEYHLTASLAIQMLRFDDLIPNTPHDDIPEECKRFKHCLNERRAEMIDTYDNIKSWYSENVLPREANEKGDLCKFFMQYIEQVDSILHLVSACRQQDWKGYLYALENVIRYFFAHDLLNYARLMPVHLAQMKALEHDDPVTWHTLKSGNFVVTKSEVPFTCLFTDQALEQEIKMLKRHGGMVGLSQDESALDRLATNTPHLARLIQEYLEEFPKAKDSSTCTEHYQLVGEVATRTSTNAQKLGHSIKLHCKGNPFTMQTPLKSLVSSALVPNDAKEDILSFAEKGQARYQEFVTDRLLPASPSSVWDPMKKLKLKTFSNCMDKSKIRVGDKVVKLREERQLFGRFLIIQGSRPELVPKLEEAIGDYEMAVVPRSICAVDGSLYISTDKASIIHAVENAKSSVPPPASTISAPSVDMPRVMIIDAMVVLQGMKKNPSMRKLSDLQDAFVEKVEGMLTGYVEGRVVFDRYIEQTLKSKTRQKRSVTSTNYEIHPEMKLTMSLKELLSSTSTKDKLTEYLAQALLTQFENNPKNLVVVYGNRIKGPGIDMEHNHEEADTLIPYQVLVAFSEDDEREIHVWSPDTDVLTMVIDLVARGRIGQNTRLKFLTGKGTKHRSIDVVDRVRVIGHRKCRGLIGLHNFTGADWGGKFVGISKKKWIDTYLKLDDEDPAIESFDKLGDGPVPAELLDGELPAQLKALEYFVCRVYCSTGPTTLPQLRWNLFRSRNLEGEILPPTRSALLPHIMRANYIAMRDKSYVTNMPDLPPIENHGWTVNDDKFVPVRNLSMPAPRAVIELTKCGCKSGCRGRCNCFSNKLPCTPLCKCYASECDNTVRENIVDEEEDAN